ncbi:hypothetical protein [Leisingera caerulea]|uniref:Uncharacterized protein n=1 Tax=Leisingera caerulea TaxID=506591 RepID=A0A9Q9HKB5_LEICA|nr:hypothetical protein [Leisingera caerulea]UWQ56021.1 hypothetical protein K3721_18880 [Leisingera caerulea]
MPAAGILQPHSPEFDRFLQAFVGEDRNGNAVTVLSTLARLELEPWEEAAALAALEKEAAGSRLEMLLSQFRDVPALKKESGTLARKLTRLLPKHRKRLTAVSGGAENGPANLSGLIWVALTILFLILQLILTGTPGTGQ